VSALPDDVSFLRLWFAIENPPLETTPPPSVTEHTFTITGTKTLRRVGIDEGGAHVVTGYLDQDKAVQYVAKIYDGLSYPLENQDTGEDFMTLADCDYAIEAWAYKTMQPAPNVVGKIVPGYHGAWTFSVDTEVPGRRRWVRMVLLQLVPGETVFDKILRASKNDTLRYDLLPDENFRLRVLRRAFEAEISIWWYGEVTHGDLEPRNVMVQPDGCVVIIDFNQAVVSRFRRHGSHPKYFEDAPHLPPSPIRRYWPWAPGGANFADNEKYGGPWARWIPQSWLDNTELAAEWLLRTWGNPPPNKYAPLDDYFLNHPAHKERAPRVIAMLEKLGRKPAQKE
jgi:serine/threonine protein kinase